MADRSARRWMLAVLLGAVATPALAQPVDRVREAQGYRVMSDFAACVVERDGALARGLIDAEPGSRAEREAVGRAFKRYDDCLIASSASRDPALLRGVVAQALYRRDYGNARLKMAAADAVFAGPANVGQVDPRTQARNRMLHAFGICVVRAQPVATRDLVLSEFGSADDARALAAIRPALGACLPKDAKADFSRTVLRGVLAEGLYRYARVAGTESGGGR